MAYRSTTGGVINRGGGMRKFICPECGSHKASESRLMSSDTRTLSPGQVTTRTRICIGCGFEIPRHLGERHGEISIEQARREWQTVYRRKARRRAHWLGNEEDS
jgi:predicted RNA-binding Zn-ribbon protein involved in translation (DUF1610 family)